MILSLDKAIASRAVFVIVSGSDGRLVNRQEIDHMCQWGPNRNPRASYRMCPFPTIYGSLTHKSGVEKTPLFGQPVGGYRKCQSNTFYDTLAGCEVTQWTILQLSPKPQMSKSRSSTICGVVERPDHHCGDDLALFKSRKLLELTTSRRSISKPSTVFIPVFRPEMTSQTSSGRQQIAQTSAFRVIFWSWFLSKGFNRCLTSLQRWKR